MHPECRLRLRDHALKRSLFCWVSALEAKQIPSFPASTGWETFAMHLRTSLPFKRGSGLSPWYRWKKVWIALRSG